MMRALMAITAALATTVCLVVPTGASAADKRVRTEAGPQLAEHPKSAYYRKRSATRVKGFVARRGGYSYTIPDTINTYGDSRSLYGGTMMFRDPSLDRQTSAGPFDHGFFFDSGVQPRGGDSPYMH
jgi:hypothetical protein